jgi:pimeloyl-ACP methyl ester carboxylesterase
MEDSRIGSTETSLADELTLRLANGLQLAAKAWGPATAPPVLALHGWLDNAASFDALAPQLPGIRLVALDLPGHGLSAPRASTAGYEFIEWLPDLFWAADALGWQRFCLLGHSLGAAIATFAAAAAPERIARLVLLDALGPLTAPAEAAPENLRRALTDRRRLPPNRLPTYPSAAVAAKRLNQANPGLSLEAAERLVARGTRAVEGGVVWRHDPRLRAHSLLRLSEEQTLAMIGAIRCPVLLLRASRGWPMPAEQLQRRLDQVAQLEVVRVEGSHHVHLVEPTRVRDPINRFLSTGVAKAG